MLEKRRSARTPLDSVTHSTICLEADGGNDKLIHPQEVKKSRDSWQCSQDHKMQMELFLLLEIEQQPSVQVLFQGNGWLWVRPVSFPVPQFRQVGRETGVPIHTGFSCCAALFSVKFNLNLNEYFVSGEF